MAKNLKALFFENINLEQTVFKNTSWLFLAEAVARILNLVLVVYIARILGATEYGKFTFAFSFVSIMAIFSDLGVIDISTREFSRKKENEKKLAGILALDVALCVFAFILAAIGSFFISKDLAIRAVVWIMMIFMLANSLIGIIFSFFEARQKMEYEAGIKIFQAIITAIFVFFVILKFPSIVNLSYAYLFSNLLILFAALAFLAFNFKPAAPKFDKSIFSLLKISWPLSLGLMVSWVYIFINSVMLGCFGMITENGWYNASSRIATASIIPGLLIIKSFYPALSKFFVESKQKLQKAWDYLLESMIVIGLPIVLGGIALAPKIIRIFYSPEYEPSAQALKLFMVVVGLGFLNFPFSIMLIVADRQKINFNLIILGAGINIILNFIFIRFFGFYGAIISTIIACFVVFVLSAVFCRKMVSISLFDKRTAKISLISAASSMAMYFVITHGAISYLNVYFITAFGGIVYFLILFLLYKLFTKF